MEIFLKNLILFLTSIDETVIENEALLQERTISLNPSPWNRESRKFKGYLRGQVTPFQPHS